MVDTDFGGFGSPMAGVCGLGAGCRQEKEPDGKSKRCCAGQGWRRAVLQLMSLPLRPCIL
jgi:hypothetical protein